MSATQVQAKIEEGWKVELQSQFNADYFKKLKDILIDDYSNYNVYPAKKNIFRAYDLCPFDQVKVVIIGQDPYHGPSQAHGLCFSVPEGIAQPPSLKNILKEIKNDLHINFGDKGDLSAWARQGVFLLNAFLTVREASPLSHSKIGWERFTDASIKSLSDNKEGIVFLLWGSNARKKKALIDESKHHILESVHPSPLSAHRGFFGCNHFSKTNDLLKQMNKEPINWEVK